MKIISTGIYVPDRVEDNSYFVSKLGLETTSEWIANKTGIIQRHYAFPNQTTSDLATIAAKNAVDDPSSLDLILVATTTPDMAIPSVATFVQRNLGAKCPAIDLNNACSGFVYALDVAYQYIKAGTYRKILVIGADVASSITNFKDRTTSPFFADGAGAVVVENSDYDCVLARHLAAEGCYEAISTVDTGMLSMDGKSIWDFALRVFPDTIRKLADQAGIDVSQIDCIVPHQANAVMIKACADVLNYPHNKVFINAEKYGNTISATIPMALHEAIEQHKISRGDIFALVGYGAGLAWGGLLLKY